VVGILNVTPDSFSDGGSWLDLGSAVGHGLALVADGADVVDVGGESTRPGAARPETEEELRRVLEVVRQLAAAGVCVTVDTMRSAVAQAAVEAGAVGVTDVSGGLADPAMLGTVADLGVAYICMHWRGHSTSMQELADYDDVVTEVRAELEARVDAALRAGIAAERLAVDPGLGFAKTADHNWQLLSALEDLFGLGLPVLVGASRKAFLGLLLADDDGQPRASSERDDATAAITALVAAQGVWGTRVHDAARSRDAVAVATRLSAGGWR
jgi:dihydropteroate synthase